MHKNGLSFTKAAIEKLPTPTRAEAGSVGYVFYWDTQLKGFGVQVRSSGAKTFVYAYRFDGRSRRFTIGKFGRLTVAQARAAAKLRSGQVALGFDPNAEKEERAKTHTLNEVLDRYIAEHLEREASVEAVRSCKRVKVLIGGLGNKLVVDIDDVAFRQVLHRQRSGNYNLIRSYVNSAWAWGRKTGYISKRFMTPADGTPPMPTTPQGRRITRSEYEAIFAAIHALSQEPRYDLARLLAITRVILTGCRPCEAARLRREHVNRALGEAKLFEHKNFRRTRLPKLFFLSAPLIEVLDQAEQLHKARGVDCPFVFPRRTKGSLSNWLAKTWKAITKRAGVDIDMRQLRSGYINAADDLGYTKEQVAALTGHMSLTTIDRHYRVIDHKRAAVNAAHHVEVLAGLRRPPTIEHREV
jgi:integrase